MTSLEEYEEAMKNAPQTRLITDKLYELTSSGVIRWHKSGHPGKYVFWCRHRGVKFSFWPNRFSLSLGQGWLLSFEITSLCDKVHHYGSLGYKDGDLSKLILEIEQKNPPFFNEIKVCNDEIDAHGMIMELLSKA